MGPPPFRQTDSSGTELANKEQSYKNLASAVRIVLEYYVVVCRLNTGVRLLARQPMHDHVHQSDEDLEVDSRSSTPSLARGVGRASPT